VRAGGGQEGGGVLFGAEDVERGERKTGGGLKGLCQQELGSWIRLRIIRGEPGPGFPGWP